MKKRLEAWGETKLLAIACCFIFDEHGALLLLKRHHKDLGGNRWGIPGGRIEAGESPIAAVKREVQEETGIVLSRLNLLGKHELHMPHGAILMTSFSASVPTGTPVAIDPDEHHALRWAVPADLLSDQNLLWGTTSILSDFGLLKNFTRDPTLDDGSRIKLVDS